ncbi:MAG: GNAT family N-acetyltransferase [Flavobacteriales bacterium]|nr:GNAT family N-acetyltransferase [Flavobacteriales bacterium]MCB9448460.1 GNAT family N-acetyltransferase [Flavobacteriales bacterium]
MLEIRPATADDAFLIALLARVTFTESFGYLFRDRRDLLAYYDRTFSEKKIADGLAKPGNRFFLAFYDRLPVGYAKLKLNCPSDFLDGEGVCQLQKIYVLRDFLSKKIGLSLYNELMRTAAKNKQMEVWLSVLSSNRRAVQFYDKTGFRKIGEHTFSIGRETFLFTAMSRQV